MHSYKVLGQVIVTDGSKYSLLDLYVFRSMFDTSRPDLDFSTSRWWVHMEVNFSNFMGLAKTGLSKLSVEPLTQQVWPQEDKFYFR